MMCPRRVGLVKTTFHTTISTPDSVWDKFCELVNYRAVATVKAGWNVSVFVTTARRYFGSQNKHLDWADVLIKYQTHVKVPDQQAYNLFLAFVDESGIFDPLGNPVVAAPITHLPGAKPSGGLPRIPLLPWDGTGGTGRY